jgi:hypothetical protein
MRCRGAGPVRLSVGVHGEPVWVFDIETLVGAVRVHAGEDDEALLTCCGDDLPEQVPLTQI